MKLPILYSRVLILIIIVICLFTVLLINKKQISLFTKKIFYYNIINKSVTGKINGDMHFRLFIPDKINNNPLFIIMHNAGPRGDDNIKPSIFNIKLIKTIVTKYNAFVFVPQCPKNKVWTINPSKPFNNFNLDSIPECPLIKELAEFVPQIISKYNLDKSKVYITGHSMGATGMWEFILRYPDIFAAAAPVCGASDPSHVEKLKDVSVWAFSGELDPNYNYRETSATIENLQKVTKKEAKFTLIKNKGHGIYVWNNDLLDWIFKQTKNK